MWSSLALLLLAVDLEIVADRIEGAPLGDVEARGDVRLRLRGPDAVEIVYADRAYYRRADGTIELFGVWSERAGERTSCARMVLELASGRAAIERFVWATGAPGRRGARLSADVVERARGGSFRAQAVELVPCTCADDALTLSVSASAAEVDPARGAWLEWPVLALGPVPIFALPALYVPLGPRRSGLLSPRLRSSAPAGLEAALPLYLTLGRSYDLTLDLGMTQRRGPLAGLELRSAPAPGASGELHGELRLDFGELGPGGYALGRPAPIVRGMVWGDHRQALGDGHVALELSLAFDPAYVAEFGTGLTTRQSEGQRSRLTYAETSSAGVRLAVGAMVLGDLRARRYRGELRAASTLGGDAGGAEVRSRWFELRLDALPRPLATFPGAQLLGETRLRVHAAAAPSPEVPRFARADLRPELGLAYDGLEVVRLEAAARLLLTGWTGRADGETLGRARIAGRVRERAETRLVGPLGDATHVLRLALEHASVVAVLGDGPGPFFAADEIDLLEPAHQLRATLSNELSGPAGRALLRAQLGADLGPDGRGLAPLVLELEAAARPVSLDASLRLALGLDPATVEELWAVVRAAPWPWLRLGLTFSAGSDAVPRALLVAPEELVFSSTLDPAGYLSPAAFAALPPGVDGAPLSARRALFADLALEPTRALRWSARAGFDLGPSEPGLLGLETRLQLGSSCDCWSLGVAVEVARDLSAPTVRLELDLAGLGGARGG